MKKRNILFIILLSCIFNNIYGASSRQHAKIEHPESSSYPYISGHTFREFCDHILDESNSDINTDKVRENDLIFVKTDYLEKFFTVFHPKITRKYKLITHNSDFSVPGKFKKYLDDEKLIVWCGQNPDISYHPKFMPIPIGIANNHWEHGLTKTFDRAIQNTKSDIQKTVLLYMNFDLNTNLPVRKKIYDLFITKSFCTSFAKKSHYDYLCEMASSKFVLCPRGNGIDCHRAWETLLMGSYPVLESSFIDCLFAELPVLIVNNYSEITEELLETKYNEIKSKNYNYKKIYIEYWLNKIMSFKK